MPRLADDNGVVRLFGPGEVIVGAIVDGKAALHDNQGEARDQSRLLRSNPSETPLTVGSAIQLEATARIFSGDPRTGVPISWSSDKPAVATVDAAGIVTAWLGQSHNSRDLRQRQWDHDHHRAEDQPALSVRWPTRHCPHRRRRALHRQRNSNRRFTPRWAVSGNGAAIDPDGAFVAEQPGSYIVTVSSAARSRPRLR